MLKLNVEIPFETADEITVANLKNIRDSCEQELSKLKSLGAKMSVADSEELVHNTRLIEAIAIVLDDLTVRE